jgi:hypothetical protein
MRQFIVFLSIFGVCGLSTEASAVVLISQAGTMAQVNGPSYDDDLLLTTPVAVANAFIPGYSSTTTGNYSTAGNSASFSGTYFQSRSGDLNGLSLSQTYVNFSTDVNVPYTASGSYGNIGGFTQLFSYLTDTTASTYLYYGYQQSVGGPAAFNLGGAGGNYDNSFLGSLTGTLLAGHTYQWYVNAYTQAYPDADLGAAAGGSVSLTIGTAVPEVSSIIVWSLLAVTLVCVGVWKRLQLSASSMGESARSAA